MPYLESVEEAQLIYEQSKENREENIEEIMGVELDAEKEQEVADVDEEGEEEHPEYLHIDPVQVQEQPEGGTEARCILKTITIPSKELQVEEARKLDKWQRYVLTIGLDYARGLVKFRKR